MTNITLQFVVPLGHRQGDYARLYWDSGAGEVDYDAPLDARTFVLFPLGGGLFGFGRAPFGRHRFGRSHARRCRGFGKLPFGLAAFGKGGTLIAASHTVAVCGAYKFAFKVFDSAGNPQAAEPTEVSVVVHTAPPRPAGLKKKTYDPETKLLTLEVDI